MSEITRKYPADEITRDPIFLLQSRQVVMTREPPRYHCDDGEWWRKDGTGDPLTGEDLLAMECGAETWRTESVWFTREEAERWAKAHAYRFSEGWRVYCVCAEGELAKLLKVQTVK